MEPASNDEVMNAFRDSVGVDPWTPGELTLLKATALKNASAGDLLLLGAIDGTTDVFFQAEGATLARETASGSAAVTWGGAGTILALASDGTNYYAADSTGIYKGTLAGGAGTLAYNTGSSPVVLSWAKQRLVACVGRAVYELTAAGPALPTALYTHPSTNWTWTSITEGPTAIYMAGYAGGQSAIYKFQLTTSGVMPTLTSGVVAASLPTGEIVHSIYAYVGSYICIGTNKGVRIGVIDTNGDISYGPLVIESTAPVKSFVGKDRFIYAACSNQIDGNSGVWRIDLGSPKQDGRFPYATDLSAGVAGTVNAVTLLGASGRLVIGVSAQGSYLESATDLVTSGWVRTGLIRFNTVEPKRFEYVTARVTGAGTVAVETVDAADTATSIITLAASLNADYPLQRPEGETSLGLKFTLTQGTVTTGPTLSSWQVKAQPAVTRQRVLMVPVMLFESMRDSKGAPVPPVDIHGVLARLETFENDSTPILFADLSHNPTRTELVVIDKIEFQ